MLEFKKVTSTDQIKTTANLAFEIWNQHFISILSQCQIDYMIEKFQSFDAIKTQIGEGYSYYLFMLNGESIGYFAVTQRENNRLFLSKIYLKSNHRGKGYAKQAFEFIKNIASENGNDSIFLTVNINNKDAISAYEKFGMKIIAHETTEIGSGYVMDDYIFEFKL